MKRLPKIVSALLLAVILWVTAVSAVARAQTPQDLLGTVSAKYESNGDPAAISKVTGDLGGASYGAYQFAGNFGVPLAFARWCVSSGANKSVGNRLIAAYETDGNAFGEAFSAQWKAIAAEDRDGFLTLQRQYIGATFYQPAAAGLMTHLKLDINEYGIAFQNAVWSRAVQHGVGSYDNRTGFLGIMRTVHESLPGGIRSLDEADLITALYEESGALTGSGSIPMQAATAGGNAWIIRTYGLEGKYLKYYSGNSSAVQAGVYLRLRVNEIKDLLAMCETYGGYRYDPDAGTPPMPVFEKSELILHNCDSLRGWEASPATALSVTSTNLPEDGALALRSLRKEDAADRSVAIDLTLSCYVDLSAMAAISLELDLPTALSPDSELVVQLRQDGAVVGALGGAFSITKTGLQTVTLELSEKPSARSRINGLTVRFENLPASYERQSVVINDLRAVAGDPETDYRKAAVHADALNCRSGPGTAYESFGLFPQNATVTVLGQGSGGWYFCSGVNTAGSRMIGWSSGDYLQFEAFTYPPCDVNLDGVTDASDALLVLKSAVGKITFSGRAFELADANGDGAITASDALIALRYAVGKK